MRKKCCRQTSRKERHWLQWSRRRGKAPRYLGMLSVRAREDRQPEEYSQFVKQKCKYSRQISYPEIQEHVMARRRYTGHCHCKAVTYEILLQEQKTFIESPEYDFCVDCRRVSGSLLVFPMLPRTDSHRPGGSLSSVHNSHGFLEKTN